MAFVHSPKIVTDGLVLALDAGNVKSYPGSGTTWSDKSGYGNDGTLTNGPTFDSGNGGSIVFDGVDDYVNCTNSIFLGTQPSTFEFWIKFNSFNTGASVAQSFHQVGTPSSNRMRLHFIRDGKFAVAYFSNDKTFNYTAVADTFYHVTYTENGSGGVQLYVNGVLEDTGVLTPPNTSGNTYWLGKYFQDQFNGYLYSHKAYNRVLSSDEILQNYNATKGRFGL